MTVEQAIVYIEDIVDKFNTEYHEPTEILERVKQESLNLLDIKEESPNKESNWDDINFFIKPLKLTTEKTSIKDITGFLKPIGGYNTVSSKNYPAVIVTEENERRKYRDPFFEATDKYPLIFVEDGILTFQKFIEDSSYLRYLKMPLFGTNTSDPLIYIQDGDNDKIKAPDSFINKVITSTIVSLTGSQFNQVLQYEWSRKNSQNSY